MSSRIAYKLFRIKKSDPGKLFPLYVLADKPTPMGVWLPAEEGNRANDGKVKSRLGNLAYRPGWHLSDEVPYVTHIGQKDGSGKIAWMAEDAVWCRCRYHTDICYQNEADMIAWENSRWEKFNPRLAQLTHVPWSGWYSYRTNPQMYSSWIIAGEIFVERVLTDKEVEKLCRKRGLTPLPRKTPFDFSQFDMEKAA